MKEKIKEWECDFVVPSENKEIYKNRIISSLFESGVLQNKVQGICFRKKINKDTRFSEDGVQEVFLQLCSRPADEIIEMFEDRPERLIGRLILILRCQG